MRIVCPNCSTPYDIDAVQLGTQGRSVRCARCRETWLARGPALVLDADPQSWVNVPDGGQERAPPVMAQSDLHDDVQYEEPAPNYSVPAVIEDAPPLAPVDEVAPAEDAVPMDDTAPAHQPSGAVHDFEPSEDIETAAARRARLRGGTRGRKRGARALPLSILALAAVLAALVAWRADVVRFAPQTAQVFRAIGLPVNLRGLAFEEIATSEETKDGVPVLVVQGRIVNTGKHAVEVPRVRLAVRSGAGVEVYAWTALPDRPVLEPGDALPFRTRLASPPAEAKDVLVRFFHRRDLLAGQ